MKKVAEKAVEMMRKTGFTEAEARVASSRLTQMQIDAGEVSLMRTTGNTSLSLRGILGGRYATYQVNQLSDRGVEDAIRKLRESAQVAPEDSARRLVDGGGPRSFGHGPAEPDRAVMHKRIETFCHTVEKDMPAIKMEQAGLSHNHSVMWAVNSKGLEFEEAHGVYSFGAMFSAKRGAKTSSFNIYGTQSADLDKELLDWGLGRELLQNSVREIDHEPFHGKMTVPLLLSPMVFHEFLGEFFQHLGDGRLIGKTSVLQEQMNKTVCAQGLTVKVSPHHEDLASREFTTGDGHLSEPSVVVENGILRSWMLSDYGSRKTGLPRALNDGAQVVVSGGGSSRANLLSGIDRGVYVGRFSGGTPAANGDFSGTAKNSFLIEGGRLAKPLSEVMMAGNIFEMLRQIRGVSSEQLNDGQTLIPWVAVDGVTVSGG